MSGVQAAGIRGARYCLLPSVSGGDVKQMRHSGDTWLLHGMLMLCVSGARVSHLIIHVCMHVCVCEHAPSARVHSYAWFPLHVCTCMLICLFFSRRAHSCMAFLGMAAHSPSMHTARSVLGLHTCAHTCMHSCGHAHTHARTHAHTRLSK